MTTGNISFFPLVVLMALLASATTTLATPEYDVQLVQIVHRHGARSPLVPYNKTLICGETFPCGHLNIPGQMMLVNVGRFLRRRYTQDTSVVSPEKPFLDTDSYNLTIAYSRSTDVLRTLQSSSALLRGLFPQISAYYPAIHTVYGKTDDLLNVNAIPAIRAQNNFGAEEEEAVCNLVVDRHFTTDMLRAIGAEVHLEEYCSSVSNRSRCATDLCDVGEAYRSTGQLQEPGRYPQLRENLDKLCAVTAAFYKHRYVYDGNNPIHQRTGSYGQGLAQEVLKHMRRHAQGDSSYRFIEYSAHDTTVTPFVSTLGDNSYETVMPPFGSTIVIELLRKRTSGEAGEEDVPYVRVFRGHPGETPETDYVFALTSFHMQCVTARGKLYTATNNVCPLADFARFIDTSSPTTAAGLCYLAPVYVERMGCPPEVAASARARSGVAPDTAEQNSLSSECLFYRTQCPAFACGPGYTLNAVDYGCYKTDDGSDDGGSTHSGVSGGVVALITIILFVVGFVVGIVFPYVRGYIQRRRHNPDIEVTIV